MQGLQPPSTAESGTRDDKNRSASVVAITKPSFQGNNVERLKKSNLSAANPIIGAPLGDGKQNKSMKVLPKLQAGGGLPKVGSQKSQMSKPAMGASSTKAMTKKTLKFASGVEGSPEQ